MNCIDQRFLDSASQCSRLGFRLLGGLHRELPSRKRGPYSRSREHPRGLSARDQQVLGHLAQGLGNADIVLQLGVAQRTVEHHVCAVLSKLSAVGRAEAVAVAREEGLLPPSPELGDRAAAGRARNLAGATHSPRDDVSYLGAMPSTSTKENRMLTESKRMAGVYGIERLALSADLANEYVSQTAIEARRFLSSEHRAMEEQHEAIRLPKPAPAQNQEVKLFGDFDHRGGPSPERCRPGAEVGRRASRPASGGKDFAPVDTVATLESA